MLLYLLIKNNFMWKFKNILIFIIAFFALFADVSAWDIKAELSINSQKLDINKNIELSIDVSWEINWWVWVDSLKWIENFDVLSKSNSTNMNIINWVVSSKVSLNYILEAKKSWKYELWPAILKYWNKEIQTNKVNIEITWDKVYVNNSQNINNNQQIITIPTINNNSNGINYIKEFDETQNKSNFIQDNFIYIILILVWILAYLIYFLMNYTSKNEENLENDYLNIKSEEINYDYPTLNDELFVDKLDNIFKQKLSKKYNLWDITWKDYSQIEQMLILNQKDQEEFLNIQELLLKSKYSNLVFDKTNLLDLIKEF